MPPPFAWTLVSIVLLSSNGTCWQPLTIPTERKTGENTVSDHYTYRITWSAEDGGHVGLCAEFPSLSWLAPVPEDALVGIRNLVSDSVSDMRTNGEPIPEPFGDRSYSGKFMVRVPPEVHRSLVIGAAEQGVSMNRLVSARLAREGLALAARQEGASGDPGWTRATDARSCRRLKGEERMRKRTEAEREAAETGWEDAAVSFSTSRDDRSAAYAEGWVRGAFVKALGILREIDIPARRIEQLATLEARLPPS